MYPKLFGIKIIVFSLKNNSFMFNSVCIQITVSCLLLQDKLPQNLVAYDNDLHLYGQEFTVQSRMAHHCFTVSVA